MMPSGRRFDWIVICVHSSKQPGQEYDGSDSGARPDEAVSWGKIKLDANPVKVSYHYQACFERGTGAGHTTLHFSKKALFTCCSGDFNKDQIVRGRDGRIAVVMTIHGRCVFSGNGSRGRVALYTYRPHPSHTHELFFPPSSCVQYLPRLPRDEPVVSVDSPCRPRYLHDNLLNGMPLDHDYSRTASTLVCFSRLQRRYQLVLGGIRHVLESKSATSRRTQLQ